MKYNFDEMIDRHGTQSVKYDSTKELWGRDDVLPLWIADMDFEVAKPIRDRIAKRIEHPVFGYARKDMDSFNSIVKHFNKK